MNPLPELGIDHDAIAQHFHWPAREGAWVRANMATSVDGASAVDGLSRGVSSDADRQVFHVLRSQCDVILVGAETVRVEGYGPARGQRDQPGPPIAVVSRSLSGLDPADRLFTHASRSTILLTTATSPYQPFLGVADVIVCGDAEVDLPAAIAALHGKGLSKVLSEGGPGVLAQLAAQHLLDELCLYVGPVLVAGAARRILEGPALHPPLQLTLTAALRHGDGVFLRYVRS
jgi:riboflavin biosynthesis pyrimidine reductase